VNSIANYLLLFTFILSGFGAWTAFMSGRLKENQMLVSSERIVKSVFILSSALIGMLIYAFISNDYSIKYVASYSNRTLPIFYKISAIWAGQSGSLLFWSWLLSLFSVIVILQNRNKNRDIISYVMSILLITTCFFFGLMVFTTNPFELLSQTVSDGKGLNPMLQNVGMVMHPPTLFLGYVGFTIPFAFAIAALYSKKIDAQWIRTTRRWTLFSWLFLTLGNLLGAKWAYVELGWGGYWAWDPVENASLMPWLTATAYLHSIMIQEQRNMLKVWNIVLIILTFSLTIFGTFITRSGLISSVHSFGVSNIGPLFLIFLAFILIFSVGLLIRRLPLLKSENELDALISRESSFIFNNLILISVAFAILWGTLFPILSEAFRGIKITVGPPFYNQVNVPFALILLALTGICPLIGWRKASKRNLQRSFIIPVTIGILFGIILAILGMTSIYAIMSFSLSIFVLVTIMMEFYRGIKARARISKLNYFNALWRLVVLNKRRYGGYIVHIGVISIFVGITGSSVFQKEKEATLDPGDTIQIANYTLKYNGIVDRSTNHVNVLAAEILVESDGNPLPSMYPSKQYFPNHDPVSEVAIRETLKEDLYIIFVGANEEDRASFKVLINPLVSWIWIGGMIMIVGTLIAAGPGRKKKMRNVEKYNIPLREEEIEYA